MRRFRSSRFLLSTISVLVLCCVSATAGSIQLEWDPVPGADGYRVYYGTESGNYLRHPLQVGSQPRAILTGLTDCTTWYVAVKAYNRSGESGYSDEISGWPRPEVRSLSPAVTLQGSQITLDLYGGNFTSGTELSLLDGSVPEDIRGNPLIRIDSYHVVGCGHIQALMTVEPASRGLRAMKIGTIGIDFQVVTPDHLYGADRNNFEVLFDPDRWDINDKDPDSRGRVDGADLSWLSYSYGSREGESYYEPDADLSGDGIVDGEDLAILAAGFGSCWNGKSWTDQSCS